MSTATIDFDPTRYGNREALLDDLRWHKFPVLNDGFVALVDVMGDDAAVVQAARVSYGKDHRSDGERLQAALVKLFGDQGGESPYVDRHGTPDYSPDQREQARLAVESDQREQARLAVESDARTLIRYLMRHRHSTPFEMAEVKILVRVPMDTWRQWVRHRTANINEYSTRYSIAIDAAQTTGPEEWRSQATSNRQGSDGLLSPEIGKRLTAAETALLAETRRVYEERLSAGVAREQARKDLPLSTYTEAYWKCDLHNLLHFLALRMDSHAQKEIRDYATVIGEKIVKPLFPVVWEAFEDYRLGSVSLTRLDVEAANILSLAQVNDGDSIEDEILAWHEVCGKHDWPIVGACRERDECAAKMRRIGLLSDEAT